MSTLWQVPDAAARRISPVGGAHDSDGKVKTGNADNETLVPCFQAPKDAATIPLRAPEAVSHSFSRAEAD